MPHCYSWLHLGDSILLFIIFIRHLNFLIAYSFFNFYKKITLFFYFSDSFQGTEGENSGDGESNPGGQVYEAEVNLTW